MKRQDGMMESQPAQPIAASRLLEEMLDEGGGRAVAPSAAAVVVGTIATASPALRVSWSGQPEPVAARTTVALGAGDVGREVTLAFEAGDGARPIVTGVLRDAAAPAPPVGVEIDGEALVLEGREQVVLRCGKASITLTRAGKVLVQGAYLSSRSTGIHRILGGAVEIN